MTEQIETNLRKRLNTLEKLKNSTARKYVKAYQKNHNLDLLAGEDGDIDTSFIREFTDRVKDEIIEQLNNLE